MNSIFVNNNSKRDFELTRDIVSMIKSAKYYLKLGNFIFEHKLIIEELIKAMDSGVALFILTNSDENKRNANRRDSEDKSDVSIEYDPRNYDKHLVNLKVLADKGAHIRCLDELHAKFMIVDGISGSIMSANITQNSLANNNETGIHINNVELLELEYVFDTLFMNADASTIGGTKAKAYKVRRLLRPLTNDSFSNLHSRMRFTLCSHGANNLQGCNVRTLYQSIIDTINASKQFCYIVTWHFNSLDRLKEFTDAVNSAVKRGVEVNIYSNDKDTSNSQWANQNSLQILKDMGCRIKGDDNNHSKCVISDSNGIIFTANIDGFTGLKKGFEVGCMLSEQQREDYIYFLKQLFREDNYNGSKIKRHRSKRLTEGSRL